MGVSLHGFDAAKVEPNSSGSPIPKGEYQVVMIESEKVEAKSGNGQMLKLSFQIVEGQHKGRKLTDRLNIWNSNAEAAKIAAGTLSAICRAVNVYEPGDSSELHNRQLTAVVDVKAQPDGRVFNEVKGYKPRQTSAPQVAAGGGFGGKPNPFG